MQLVLRASTCRSRCLKLIAAAGVIVWVSTTPMVGQLAIGWLEEKFPPMPVGDCPSADAVAVLGGGGALRNRRLRPGETPNRLEAGLALIRIGKAPHLLVFRSSADWPQGVVTAPPDIPAERFVVLEPAWNTVEETRAIAAEALHRNWSRVVLVTSSFHMRRALVLLRGAIDQSGRQVEVIPFAADWGWGSDRAERGLRSYFPSASGYELSRRAFREIAGLWAYSAGLAGK